MTMTHQAPSAEREMDSPSHDTERQAAAVHGGAGTQPGFLQERFGELIGNPILRHPSTSGVRAVLMRRAQQQLGNRAAQHMAGQVQRSTESEEETKLPSAAGAAGAAGASQPEPRALQSQTARSRGEPMAEDTRKDMESRFGRDFGDVRVHRDRPAAEMSTALHADAFTAGRDIYFAQGQYSPDTREGRRLLAHELTHTVQQDAASSIAAPAADTSPVSSPEDSGETEAERVSDAVMAEEPEKSGQPAPFQADANPEGKGTPESAPRGLIAPARGPVIHRQQQKRPPMVFPKGTMIATSPNILLFMPPAPIGKHWDLLKPTFAPLAGGTFLVDGIPVSYSLEGQAAAWSNAMLMLGPGILEDIHVIVTGPEAERMRRPRIYPNPLAVLGGSPIIVLPPDSEPHGSFAADGMARFSAVASADIHAFARLNGELGLFLNALNAGAFAELDGSARGDVVTNVDTFVEFQWTGGAIKLSATLDLAAALTLAFHLNAFAGVWVELRVPDIPVVTDLTHAVQSWPIVGWFVPDLKRWKWRKEYRKDWPLLDKTYTWQLQQRFVIGNGSVSASVTNPEGFRMDSVLAELQGQQKEGDVKNDPEGPGKERRNSDTGAVSAAKASALAQIGSAKHAADREKQANTRLLIVARKAKAAAKATPGSTGTPMLAAIGTTSDPVTDLEKREENLNDAVASTEQLRKRADALDAPASAPDGVSRNEARSGFEAIATNADALSDKINKNEEGFAVPATAEPSDADYKAMHAALLKANNAFDDCFDIVRTEKLYADDQVRAAGTDVDLHPYRDAAVLYQGRALKLWNKVQQLDNDIEKAREWYEQGDHAAGAKVFDELETKAISLKDQGETLQKSRPVGDWDTDYVELSAGHLQLKPQYRGKSTRSYFYPHDYSAATQNRMWNVIGSVFTGADGKTYWEYRHRKSPRGDFRWLVNDDKEKPTLDHTAPTVVAQWNHHGGRTTVYAPRRSFYDFQGAALVVVPQTLNSSAGGREPDSYTPYVTRTFRGAKT